MHRPFLFFIACLSLAGTLSANEPISFVVSIPPLKWFVEQMIPEADVAVLLDEGADPHTFAPSPSQVRALHRADVWVTAGLPFERALQRALHDTKGPLIVAPDAIAEHDHESHEAHEEHEEHQHEDPHWWLGFHSHLPVDLALAHRRFVNVPENHGGNVAPGAVERTRELLQLEAALRNELVSLLAPHEGRAFFVLHPAFGHFAEAFGLRQMAVEVEGRAPSPRQLRNILEQMRSEGATTLFVQPQGNRAAAEAIARAADVELVEINPLRENWPVMMREIGEALARSFERSSKITRQAR
ncbi:MAG: metal ABC transporter solute-binding protein, Zn/Mn family [Opitutales bacterium]